MFLKDGKSLSGNLGIIISLIILIILLLLSYNKCIVSGKKEGFVEPISIPTTISVISPTNNNDVSFIPPHNPRINITGSTITLNFTVKPIIGNPLPIQFMIVLVQYDYTLTPTGNNKFFISNENKINPDISNTTATTTNGLCQLINGNPECNYIFNNVDMIDTSGKPYYYKIGISAVYTNGNSKFVLPYNIVNSNGIFSLTSSLDTQNNQFNDYIKYKQLQTDIKSTNYSNTLTTHDSQYELIKSQLGGYPSNLVMEPTSAKQNMIADLVDKSMAHALLNINVNTIKDN